ncbi:AcrR family transcriptional regulator [Sporosarcina luteola]|nr:AcrR family transcriptional regulator [Sporosarcina luteola]
MEKLDKRMEELLQSEGDLTEKQRNILAAATEMFAQKGFAATSTSEIAKKAGVAEGTIFRHYKTKKDLLLSIVSPTMLRMISPFILKDINKVLNQDYERFEDFLREMIKNRQAFLDNNLQVVKVVIQEIPFHPELRDQFIQHVGQKVYQRFSETVQYYQAKGQIADIPPATVLRNVSSVILGYFATKYIVAPVGWDEEKEIDELIAFLAKGLAPE